jgi:hypothetical protein
MSRVPKSVVKKCLPRLLTTAVGLQLMLEHWKEGDDTMERFYSVVFVLMAVDINNESDMADVGDVDPEEWHTLSMNVVDSI